MIAGSELGEHPYDPITPASRRRAAELGDELPVGWRHRDERYTEKLATPDTAVADLIGDVDPVKVAEGRSLGDPETIHYGLVPRAHRGIVAINELPDLAERIQVSLLNVMEERDIQVRGYTLRLPLDVLLVASANPEDYTNRGRIITPLKDRFGAEVRTHYPLELADEIALVEQEAELVADVPRHLLEIIARFTRALRESTAIDQGSGVSARFAVAAAETVAAAALRRAALTGEDRAGGPPGRPRVGARGAARQAGVRLRRGGPRDRAPGAPAAPGHRRHRPPPAARARPEPAGRGRVRGTRCAPGSGCRRPRWWPRCRPSPCSPRWPPGSTRRAPRTRARWPAPPSWRWSCCSSTRRLSKDQSDDGETVSYG